MNRNGKQGVETLLLRYTKRYNEILTDFLSGQTLLEGKFDDAMTIIIIIMNVIPAMTMAAREKAGSK